MFKEVALILQMTLDRQVGTSIKNGFSGNKLV